MPCKCNTSDDPWTSHIKNVEEGLIEIGTETGAGDFDGTHHAHGQLKGRCTGVGIVFHVPATNPQYLYRGTFTDDRCKKIIGTRTRLPNFDEAEAGAALFSDDWVATKPPALRQESPESSAQEPSTGKAADETSSGQ